MFDSKTELNTWPLIKAALQQCFGDRRSLECLEQDLIMVRSSRNEHPIDFAKRLQVLRSHLVSRINNFSDIEMALQIRSVP